MLEAAKTGEAPTIALDSRFKYMDTNTYRYGLDVVRLAIVTPQYQTTSIAYRADRRATHVPNNSLKARHVEALMEKKGGPEAANRLKKDLGQLFRFAAKRYGFAGQNPSTLADSHKVRSASFHTWTDDEIDTFRARLTTTGMAKLGAEPEQILSNLPERLDKRGL